MIELKKENLVEALQKSGGLIVDFWAPWCSYCRRLAPVFEKVAENYEKEFQFAKLNIDEFNNIDETYNIEVIPTLGYFKDGILLDKIINPKSINELEDWLNKLEG